MFLVTTIVMLLAQVAQQTSQPAVADANTQNTNAKPPEKCSIQGKVVNAVTGEPLKKAHLTLQGNTADSFNSRSSVMTEADGTFALKDVDPGTYRLSANRTGFAPGAYGAKKASTMGADLKLSPGQAMSDIVVRMQPQSVVTGKITDTDGDPVANVTVSLVRSFYQNGQRRLLDGASATTNDLGEYRIFGVQAGKYRLRATLRSNMFNNTGEQEDYAPTYYPGQADSSSAALLEVQPGQTLQGVNMAVLSTPTRRVRGKVLLTSGHTDNIQVMVTSREQGLSFNMRRGTMVTPAKPSFEFRLPPGSYTVTAYYNDGGGMVSGTTPVDVGNTDVDNVAVSVQPGADLTGRLRIDGANDLKALAQSTVRINLFPKDNGMFFGSQPARLNDDGTFTLKNVGVQTMNVSVMGLPSGYYVKSISYGQQDAKANGLSYTGSNDAVDIVISPNAASVTGIVRNHAGDPVPGAIVVLAPPMEQRSRAQNFRAGRTDQNGRFSLQGIEPNDYTLFAWEDIENGEYMDPDVLKAAENHGKPLKLKESAQESLDVESIPAEETPASAGF